MCRHSYNNPMSIIINGSGEGQFVIEEALEGIFKFTSSELKGNSLSILFGPKTDVVSFENAVRSALNGATLAIHAVVYDKSNFGQNYTVRCAPHSFDRGRIAKSILTFQPSHCIALSQAFGDNFQPKILISAAPPHVVHVVNNEFTRIFGLAQGDVLGKPIAHIQVLGLDLSDISRMITASSAGYVVREDIQRRGDARAPLNFTCLPVAESRVGKIQYFLLLPNGTCQSDHQPRNSVGRGDFQGISSPMNSATTLDTFGSFEQAINREQGIVPTASMNQLSMINVSPSFTAAWTCGNHLPAPSSELVVQEDGVSIGSYRNMDNRSNESTGSQSHSRGMRTTSSKGLSVAYAQKLYRKYSNSGGKPSRQRRYSESCLIADELIMSGSPSAMQSLRAVPGTVKSESTDEEDMAKFGRFHPDSPLNRQGLEDKCWELMMPEPEAGTADDSERADAEWPSLSACPDQSYKGLA